MLRLQALHARSLHRSDGAAWRRRAAPPKSGSGGESGESGAGGAGDAGGGGAPEPSTSLPSFTDGVNYLCTWILGLLFLADFTPLGALLLADGPSAPTALSAMQWAVFVVPTAVAARGRGWDLAATFRLRPCRPAELAAAAAAGPALLSILTALISRNAGSDGGGGAAADAAAQVSDAARVLSGAGGAAALPGLLMTAALSPAAAEELLFRGFLLTAALQRFGRVDAVMVVGAAFAATHLDPATFFPLAVLGFACGAAGVLSGSILPPIVLHASYNAAALIAGAAAAGGG
jgi:membrane protease YdiL (CAAX protease family)